MPNLRAFLLACAAAVTIAAPAKAATVLGFDDLSGVGNAFVPTGYGGLSWTNVYSIGGAAKPGSGYAAGVISPHNVAYNGGGQPAAITAFGGLFAFQGAWLTGAFRNGMTVRVVGERDFEPLYVAEVVVNTDSPVFLDVDWTGLDRLRFESLFDGTVDPDRPEGTRQFAIDEFRYTLGGAGAVPEPGTWALMFLGFGFAGAALRARRRGAGVRAA